MQAGMALITVWYIFKQQWITARKTMKTLPTPVGFISFIRTFFREVASAGSTANLPKAAHLWPTLQTLRPCPIDIQRNDQTGRMQWSWQR